MYADYRRPESWAERLQIEPIAPLVKGTIIEVNIDEPSGITVVDTDQSLDNPAQRFDRGTLINDGQEFQVIALTTGPKLELTVSNLLDPNGN
jgi:hypothetical protein